MTTVPKSMRASVPVDKQTVEMQERPVPAAAGGEVLVRSARSGCAVRTCTTTATVASASSSSGSP